MMTYLWFAIALFSAIATLNCILRFFAVAFTEKRWLSSAGPFLNYLQIALFGTLSVYLFMQTIPVIFG